MNFPTTLSVIFYLMLLAFPLTSQASSDSESITYQGIEAYQLGDYTKALQCFREGAGDKHPLAQSCLGNMYYAGLGVPQDYKLAMEWFTKAADQGFAPAQCNLARMYQAGEGCTPDYAQAFNLFSKAAEQGYAAGVYGLATMYAWGMGVPKDAKKGVELIHKAADHGFSHALFTLGETHLSLYHNRELGTEEDADKAFDYFFQAAMKGHSKAQLIVGELYEKGQGTELNKVESYRWLTYAIESGVADAIERRQILRSTMTDLQVQDARELVNEWQPPKEDFFF